MKKTIKSRICNQVCHVASLAFLLFAATASAQEVNKIYVGDVNACMEEQFYVPVYLENTRDDITAVQFDIELPNSDITYGFNSSSVKLNSERIDGHTAKVQYRDTKARVVLSSSSNNLIKGNEGELLRIPLYLRAKFVDGQVIKIKISNVMIANTSGDNVITDYAGGSVIVDGGVDFEVRDVRLIDVDSIAPGDTLTCQYTVKNIGTKGTMAGFSATIYLISSSTSSNVSSSNHDDLLEPGDSIVITETIPLSTTLSIKASSLWPRLTITPKKGSGEVSNFKSNNTLDNTNDSHILKSVYSISPVEATWNESEGGNKFITLYRYGSTAEDFYFDVELEKGDSRVKLSRTNMRFSPGNTNQSIYVSITDDEESNEDDEVIVSFTKRNETNLVLYGYYKLVDDEANGIRLTSSLSEVTEGDTFVLTATLPEVATNDVEVFITCNYNTYFSFPAIVTIPTGEQFVSFQVTAVDDDVVSNSMSVKFIASSYYYTKGSRTITWNDNDDNLFSNIVDEEWQLLQAIYQKANGANWKSNRWTIKETKEATGSLDGVNVSNGHVIELLLPSRQMNCELIPEFFMFPKLKNLDLSKNQLAGDVQTVFSQIPVPLQELNTLSLSKNQLTGNLGTCGIAELMPVLQTLYIDNNKIRDIRPALPKSIKSIKFSNQTLDENIGSFTDLYCMTSSERVFLLPSVITYLHNLQSYDGNPTFLVKGDDWGIQAILNKVPEMAVYSGFSPWNKKPSGQTLTLQSSVNYTAVAADFDFEQGNVNFDGDVDLSDLQTLINFALKTEQYAKIAFNFYAADLIADDVVNVQDVVAQINLMLDMGISPNFARRRLARYEMKAGAENANCIYVENGWLVLESDTPVAALDIMLDCNEAKWTEAISCFSKKCRGGRSIFYSLFGDEIPVGKTILASLDGNVMDAMAVDLEGNKIPLCIGLDEVNGIDTFVTTTDEPQRHVVYDLSGRQIVNDKTANRQLQKGIYIVNGKKQVIK